MINGELVGLRAIETSDLERLKEWRNSAALRRNFREYRELNLENQMRWFDSLQQSRDTQFMFLIERLSDKEPLGACGLLSVNWIIRSADFSLYVGYQDAYIDKEGYALEAALLLINYGFSVLNLHKVWMEVYEFDHKKLDFFIEKLNFVREGRLRDNCFEDGRYWDSFIISLLQNDHFANK